MRIRTIKPEFWQSESLSRVSREARLLFIGLFSACDDSGRTRAASRFLASLLFPYDLDALSKIDGWLEELEVEGCVRRYKVDGNTYLEIPKWFSHQKIDKPSKSKLPSFDEASRALPEDSRTFVVGSGIRDQGKDQGSIAEPDTDQAPAKAVAREIAQKPERPRNELLDTLATIGGGSTKDVTETNWKLAAKALKSIKAVAPDLTADEIKRRAKNLQSYYKDLAITANFLEKNWAMAATPKRHSSFDEIKIDRS